MKFDWFDRFCETQRARILRHLVGGEHWWTSDELERRRRLGSHGPALQYQRLARFVRESDSMQTRYAFREAVHCEVRK